MQEWYILGVGKGVLFREVSSVQECPHRERGSTVSPLTCGIAIWIESKIDGLFHSILIWDDTSVHTLRLVSELRP